MKTPWYYLGLLLFLISCNSSDSSTNVTTHPNEKNFTILLQNDWFLRISKDAESGGKLSELGINSSDWVKTEVPNTVLASLVNAGVYKDIYSGMNMESIPTGQFKSSWMYFKSFSWVKEKGENVVLDLNGVNYRANIWLNGKQIADTSTVFGVYKQYEFDITSNLKGENNLVIEVFPPVPGDFTIGFVDWAPVPADNNMGIWREVSLVKSQGVALTETYVYSDFDVKNPTSADLFVSTLVTNNSKKDKELTLNGTIGSISFTHKTTIKGGEKKVVKLSPETVSELKISNPKLWWPHTMGEPNLYTLKLEVLNDAVVSSNQEVTFGIRKVEDYLNENGHRGYIVNGQKLLIKGAGWVDDLILANDAAYDEAQILYTKQMNFNTIRFEGFWGKSDRIYDLCDKHGLLLMVGFSCQWEWSDYLGGKKFNEDEDGFGGVLEPNEIELVAHYFKDQVKWLRNHPSIFVYTVGSDRLPHPDLELKELAIIKEYSPSTLMLSAAKLKMSEHTGTSGVKMEGPYDYVTPNYWYTDTIRGGAFGFNTETGPGPQPPVMYSINKMIPKKENQWPLDNELWKYHSGRHAFGDMSKFLKAFDARYGKSETVEDFAKFAQVASYEAMRPMYESFEVNRPNTTGIIQWMLNSAWPETYWQLYDSYLHPTGAFYGAKNGSRNTNVIYNYGDEKVYVSNESLDDLNGKIKVVILDTLSNEVYSATFDVSMKAAEVKVFDDIKSHLPDNLNAYFVDLKLMNQVNEVLADNLYWLSTKPDVIDPNYEHSSWVYTPNLSFTNLTYIRRLPEASLSKIVTFTEKGEWITATIELSNSSKVLSFFNEVTLVIDENTAVLPVIWSDNYISLLPNETKTIEVKVMKSSLNEKEPKIVFNTVNTVIE
jgi:exo-1,4-beta-D-glucosaminidase